MARRTKEEALITRDRILDAAEQAFSTRGVSRTSLGDIAVAAGVAAGHGQVYAQQGGQQRRAVGATTAGADAYPTDDQYRNSKDAQALVQRAFQLAGQDWRLQERFEKSCGALGPQRPAVYRQNAGLPPEPTHVMEPIKIFDNMYYMGYNTIGAWAIPTSQGIILIDALNNEKDAVDGVLGVIGFGFGGQGQNVGLVFVRLKPFEERKAKTLAAAAVARRPAGGIHDPGSGHAPDRRDHPRGLRAHLGRLRRPRRARRPRRGRGPDG